MTTTDRERALSQIRKMMNTANDAGATEGEVTAALGRISHLMRTHDLSETEVDKVTRADGTVGVRITIDPATMVNESVYGAATLDRWVKQLAMPIARLVGCGVYLRPSAVGTDIRFFGLPADVAVGRELLEWARKAMLKSCRAWCKKMRTETLAPYQTNGSEARSYKDGFVMGVITAEKEAASSANADDKVRLGVSGETSTALVLVSDVDEAKATAVAVLRKDLSLSKARRSHTRGHDSNAYGAGSSAGRSTNLSRNTING